MKNKHYKMTVNILLSINIILMILKYGLGVTLYYDWCDDILWIIWILILIVCPNKASWYIVLCKVSGIIIMLFLSLSAYWHNADINYMEVHSPSSVHSVVLKEYRDFSFHHPYYTVDIYKRVAWIFKKSTRQKIYAYKTPFSIQDGLIIVGKNKYRIGNDLYIEWPNEHVLHIYCDIKQTMEDEILDAMVKL